MTQKHPPLPYQVEKITKWDADNRTELEDIQKTVQVLKQENRKLPRSLGLRVSRLQKSVKAAERYRKEIGYVRPPKVDAHEPGDGV